MKRYKLVEAWKWAMFLRAAERAIRAGLEVCDSGGEDESLDVERARRVRGFLGAALSEVVSVVDSMRVPELWPPASARVDENGDVIAPPPLWDGSVELEAAEGAGEAADDKPF